MIRTTLALATAGLFLVACDAKPAPEAAKPAATAVAPGDADAAAAAKAMTDMAAAMSSAGANTEIKNPHMKAFADSFDQMVAVVLTVHDEASAKAIGPQMQPIMAKLDEQSKALEALPESERQAASMQSLGRISGATMKMAQHIASLPPEVQKTLNAELEKVPQPK